VWLDGDGSSTEAALALWKLALGDDVLIAVVEPPYRERAPDLRVTGRWAWPDTYAEDQGRVIAGVERIVEYLGDRWTIDAKHVVIAGVGAGGAAALWAGLYGDLDGATIVAVQPDELTRLGEAGLPNSAPAIASATLIAEATRMAEAARTLELAGIDTQVDAPQPHRIGAQTEALLRRGLGLEALSAGKGSTTRLALPVDTPIAWQWGMLHARLRERDPGVRVELALPPGAGAEVLAVKAEQFADGRALPTAPGPFGGTTILVLPRGVRGKERAAWIELGEKDVLKARNRFASLRVVDEAGLAGALDEIRQAGKRNVLVVPAAFVVGPQHMQALQERTVGHADGLTIAWLPGLGGELAEVLANASEHRGGVAR
jgi:hypothetical protein